MAENKTIQGSDNENPFLRHAHTNMDAGEDEPGRWLGHDGARDNRQRAMGQERAAFLMKTTK